MTGVCQLHAGLFGGLLGRDPAGGHPTRDMLESIDLGYVADKLERNGKLGRS